MSAHIGSISRSSSRLIRLYWSCIATNRVQPNGRCPHVRIGDGIASAEWRLSEGSAKPKLTAGGWSFVPRICVNSH